jgi:DNA-binding SARP family transcriptional activator
VRGGTVFRVLGPLEVSVRDRPVVIRAAKQRAVLATLLLRPERTISIEEFGENLWDEAAPVRVRPTVQKYVMRVRRSLSASGCAILTEPDGYRLELRGCTLDLQQFADLADAGTRAARAGDHTVASIRLASAQELWRAVPPLSNVDSPALVRTAVARLVERYLQVCETRIEADLHLGRHSRICEELIELVFAYPFRERLWALRMRALHGEGRQGEALAVFRQVSRLLRDELGVDPGPVLRAAHQEVLSGGGGPPVRALVRQLPMATSGIVGRSSEIEAIVRSLTAPAAGSPRLVLVTGAAGIGKTAVAVAAAHRLAEIFPDGQLFVRLGRRPPGPRTAEALTYFLRALGVPADQLPASVDDAAALYRSLTAAGRFLVVLDDAFGTRQVRMLLPGSSVCGVLVTGRRAMPGLLMDPGAEVHVLDRLGPDDARRLLVSLLGTRRAVDATATDELVGLCDGRPWALRAVAANLATRPDLPVSALLRNLGGNGAPVRDATWERLVEED